MFELSDIIVFDGVISIYGVLKIIVKDLSSARKATNEEKEIYYNRP